MCANFSLGLELSKKLWFSFCRHQVLRIIPRDEIQLSVIKALEDIIEFEVIYHPLAIIKNKKMKSKYMNNE